MTTEPLKLVSTEINSANVLAVAVGTNGYKGGDAGHGSRTEFRLKDRGATEMKISVDPDGRGVTIQLAGDSELHTFTEALDFAVRTLRKQANAGSKDDENQQERGNPMSTNRGEYRLVVGSDPREFAREVSKALADGWELYGEPILREAPGGGGADTADDSPRYLLGQAVTRPSLALR